MNNQPQIATDAEAKVARYAEGAKTLLKRRLEDLLAQPQDGADAVRKARRAAREAELWLVELEHLQCVRMGINLPASSTLGCISKFRCHVDSALGQRRQQQGEAILSARLLDQASTLLARLSPPAEDAIVFATPEPAAE